MKVNVISYSHTGNNRQLAESLATRISAVHTVIEDKSERTGGLIAREMLFGGTPDVTPSEIDTSDSDLLLFVGPVWMGQPASPFRSMFKSIRDQKVPYAYISVSGGALGPNKRLARSLEKKAGRKPEAIVDLQIARLFMDKEKSKVKETSAYTLSPEDAKLLTGMVMEEIGDLVGQIN